MPKLQHDEVLYFLIQISLLLVFARLFGEIFRMIRQPRVVGEIIGGILLGPSVFKQVFPETFTNLFLNHPGSSIAMDGLNNVALVMLLFISGMEVELPLIWKNGRSTLFISLTGLIIPLGIGFATGWYFYEFFGQVDEGRKLAFSLFMGTALSITALPVIAKILLDLNLFTSKVGNLIIACAMMDDFVGWILFSVVLSMLPGARHVMDAPSLGQTIFWTVSFALFVLIVVKFVFSKLFSYLQKLGWNGPGATMTMAMVMCFLGAVFTEYIGVHAVFGAFLMGIAFGESMQFSERSKDIIHQFVANIFAPLFFVSIGLKVNFFANFDIQLIGLILLVSFISKILGGFIGGKLGRLSNYESWAIGFGINARGAMEIILGLVALNEKLISESIFVALTVMAILTSVTSGTFIKFFLKKDGFFLKKVVKSDEVAG